MKLVSTGAKEPPACHNVVIGNLLQNRKGITVLQMEEKQKNSSANETYDPI